MKNTKHRFAFFSFYDHTGIEKHLEDMARTGWMIEHVSNLFWTYRRIEPQKLHFTVSYYPKASDFDPIPSQDQQTFLDFCAQTKWVLACTWFQMQIFYNFEANPIPIDTDPTIEVETIHKACKANYLKAHKLLFIISLILTLLFLSSFISDTLKLIASPMNFTIGCLSLLLFLISSVELISYEIWHKKAKKAAEQEIFLETPSTASFKQYMVGLMILVLAYWIINLIFVKKPFMAGISFTVILCVYATFFLTNTIKKYLKRKQISTGTNQLVTLIGSFLIAFVCYGIVLSISVYVFWEKPVYDFRFDEEVPLQISDLIDTDHDYLTTMSTDESIFLEHLEIQHMRGFDDKSSSNIPELKYDIYNIKIPIIYEFSKGSLKQQCIISAFGKGHMVDQDSKPWGAEEVYRFVSDDGAEKSKFLLCYDKTLVLMECNWEPTTEQMAIIKAKLGH